MEPSAKYLTQTYKAIKTKAVELVKHEFKELQTDYARLKPIGLDQPSKVSTAPGNDKKNRYRNIVAFDHSRVVLSKTLADEDYINANWVGGKSYIASQGPIPETIDAFWHMVWQEKVL